MIERGGYYLQEAARWNVVSKYYLEASIAYWHTIEEDGQDKWENILQLYNRLLQLEYSPVAALNRTYALFRANGRVVALSEANKLDLQGNHFYHILLGELYNTTDKAESMTNYEKALQIAKTETEKRSIQNKIDRLL